MYNLLVGEVFALGHLDRVDIPNEVRDGGVGGGQLFGISALGGYPFYLERVAALQSFFTTGLAYRSIWIVIYLAVLDYRNLVIQQMRQAANQARLRLASFAEKDHVVAGEDRVFKLWNDRMAVTDYAGKQLFAGLHLRDEILSHLLPDRQGAEARLSQLFQCLRLAHFSDKQGRDR